MSDDESTGIRADAATPPPVVPPAPIVPPAYGPASASPPPVPPQFQAPPRYGPSATPTAPSSGWVGQGAGWAPPPRPGLIPLAPLTFGTILGAPYRLFRRNPRPTFGMSLLLQGGITFLALVVVGLVAWATLSRADFAQSSADQDQLIAGSVGLIALSALIPFALSVLAGGLMQGVIVLEVARQTLGEKSTFRELWRRGRGRIWAVAGYSLAVFLIIGLVLAVVIGISVVPFALGGSGGSIAGGIIAAIVLYLGLVVLYAWLGTKLTFVPSAIVLEKLPIIAAVGRSWSLTRGSFWKTLGTVLLVTAILGIAANIVQTPLTLVIGIIGGLAAPTGDENAAAVAIGITYVIAIVITLVLSAISLVVQSATTALLYIDRRVRTEGLDLDLMRFVEARQSGADGLRDPFDTPSAADRAARFTA